MPPKLYKLDSSIGHGTSVPLVKFHLFIWILFTIFQSGMVFGIDKNIFVPYT
jgi:hypothetical protein